MTAELFDLNREVSLMLLKSSRAYAVRTPKGQKDPGHFKWDPKANNKETSEQTIHQLERSDDNIGIHLFGAVVDVDVDTDNPYMTAALDYFLPPTSHIWGRPSRPRTHRLYELTGAKAEFDRSQFPFLDVIQQYPNIAVEVRGGQPRNGEYSLLPGSLHPSGEAYQWEDIKAARSTPISVDVGRIVNGVRFACVAALLAPYWVEGVRNQLCMAFSGFMHRAAVHVQEMGSASALEFGIREAKDLLLGLLRIADDDPSDLQMRLRTFEQTWEKGESGLPIAGATTIEKITGDTNIVPILYTLLADSPDMVEFDQFMERYAIRNSSSTIIDIERAGSKRSKYVMTVQDFGNSTMHKTIKGTNGGKTPMAALLLRSSRAIRVEGLTFDPSAGPIVERREGKFINQWRGFEIEMWPEPVGGDEVQVVIDYFRDILANKDEKLYEWIVAWVADIFKHPASKAGTALVLVGKPGAGKSLLGEKIIRPIIGTTHSAQTNTVESLTGNFNADSSNLLFMQADEAMNSRRRQDANKLKSMITDKTRRMEFKGHDAFETEDYCRYTFTSNDVEDAVAIVDGEDDRRYTVSHVNEEYAEGNRERSTAEKREYWRRLHAFLEEEDGVPHRENLAKVHRWLYDQTYPRDLIRSPYSTRARKTMMQHSQRGFDDWLMELATFEHPFENLRAENRRAEECRVRRQDRLVPALDEWPHLVAYTRLQESYDLYRKRKGMVATTSSYNAQQIKQAFVEKGLLPKEADSTRVDFKYSEWVDGEERPKIERKKLTQIPTRERIRAYLFTKYGYVVDNDERDVTDQLGVAAKMEDNGPKF